MQLDAMNETLDWCLAICLRNATSIRWARDRVIINWCGSELIIGIDDGCEDGRDGVCEVWGAGRELGLVARFPMRRTIGCAARRSVSASGIKPMIDRQKVVETTCKRIVLAAGNWAFCPFFPSAGPLDAGPFSRFSERI